jgi:hypothetical protein
LRPEARGRDRLRILLSGRLAGAFRQGGLCWVVLQYLLGFRRLGHDVRFVEPLAAPEEGAPARHPDSAEARYFREVVTAFGLGGAATLVAPGGVGVEGSYERLRVWAEDADLLVNLSGTLEDEALVQGIPVRAYVDLDPAFTQLWQASQGIDMGFEGHTHFVTIGEAVGTPDCAVPTCGRRWIRTPQPVVLSEWPAAARVEWDALTTVAHWRGYGSVEHDGIFYGQKAHSLRPLMDLPTRTSERFLLALGIHPDERTDLEALRANRWELLDPGRVVHTPQRYRDFVRGSRAEFGVAKSGYVASGCGWFSDRSITYLASGRPVIAQETGFSRFVPTGEGLFSFTSAEDALAAVEALRSDYARHARAARALAESYFDSDRVLSRLLDHLGASS